MLCFIKDMVSSSLKDQPDLKVCEAVVVSAQAERKAGTNSQK
jgi:hypothetical protein